jgi:hypothetical protein
LLRLRKVSGPDAERQPELRGRCSVVRELHVYGTAVAVHARDASKFQHQVGASGHKRQNSHASVSSRSYMRGHEFEAAAGQCQLPLSALPTAPASFLPCLATVQGYGTLLMEEAERIARFEHRSTKLAVISGVGTRHYYRKLGWVPGWLQGVAGLGGGGFAGCATGAALHTAAEILLL